MTPFALQAEMTRQWFGFAEALAAAFLSAYATMGRQAIAGSTATSHLMRKPGTGAPGAPARATEADAVSQSIGPFSPFMLWAHIFTMPGAQAAGAPFIAGLPAFFWPFQMQPFEPWFPTVREHRTTIGSIEHAGASYRTASGYATAVIMDPFATPLASRNQADPRRQPPGKRKTIE